MYQNVNQPIADTDESRPQKLFYTRLSQYVIVREGHSRVVISTNKIYARTGHSIAFTLN